MAEKASERLTKMVHPHVIMEEIRQVEEELQVLRRSQETAAWQRCRPFVIRDDDCKTTYLHNKASERKKKTEF